MITTYGELQTEIANWLDREDQTDNIPSFIKLAESKIYRKLRSRENEFTAQYNDGTTPAAVNPIALPQNFREPHLVMLDNLPLEHVSSQEYYRRVRFGWQGDKTYFTIIGQELHLYPWTDDAADLADKFTLDLIYYGTESLGEMATWDTPKNPNQVPESDGTPADTAERTDAATTRLLQVAPDVYLYGALVEAYKFLRDPTKMVQYQGHLQEVMNELEVESELAAFSGSTTGVSSIYSDGVP